MQRILALAVLATLAAALATSVSATPPAAGFSARVDNPWFPLKPGTRYVYTGVKDGQPSRDVVTVTHRTRTIAGVPCVVVEDRLYLRGRLGERTVDWYTRTRAATSGTSASRRPSSTARGRVTSTEGTWRSGVDGAQRRHLHARPPRVGQTGRQEYYKGHAEDHFKVIGLFGTPSRAPRTKNALLVQETTPLEPGTVDHKLYVRGIGIVLEQTERGGDERNELVAVTHGG